MPVDAQGAVDPDDVRAAITDKTILVSVHHVNHEIGAIQPVREIGALARERGIAFYVDAEAGAGWLPVDAQEWGASLLSFSPHRFYGPKGVGVFYQNRRARLAAILQGGDQENGRRAGVENVPAHCRGRRGGGNCRRDLAQRRAHCARLQRRLWEGLRARIPRIKLNGPEPGPGAPSGHVEHFRRVHRRRSAAIAVRHAWHRRGQRFQLREPVAQNFPCPRRHRPGPGAGPGSIILSLGRDNSEEDVDYVCIETFPKIVAKLRALSPSWQDQPI